jgi:hypothetical protein
MSGLYAIAASLTLFAPFSGHLTIPQSNVAQPAEPAAAPQCLSPQTQKTDGDKAEHHEIYRNSQTPAQSSSSPIPSQLSATNALEAFYNLRTANQHRVQRRVTIRITPYRQSNRNSLLAQLPRRGVTSTFEEREMASCVPVSGIAGVQTGTGNRLLLFLRDQRIISLNLERGCEARDFYSGFYVERSEDGRLCVKRDQLQSRSGAKCEVERMRRLVKAED